MILLAIIYQLIQELSVQEITLFLMAILLLRLIYTVVKRKEITVTYSKRRKMLRRI